MPARAIVQEAPTIREWGPFFRARYTAVNSYTVWTLVLMIPFTRTRASLQFRVVVFDHA